MNFRFIKNLVSAVFLLFMGLNFAQAATPMLYFTSQPGSVSLSGTTSLSYAVHNNVPSPMPLTSFSFTSSSDYTATITNSCGTSGHAIVPANGDCTITVALAAGAPGTTTNAKLTIGYSNQPGTQLVSNGITVTTTDTGTVSFTTQPSSPQAVTVGGTTNLTYQISNTTNINQPLTSLAFTQVSNYNVGTIIVSGTGTCGSNIIPAASFCTITVPIIGVTQGVASGQLSVNFGSTPAPVLGSNLITFNISGTSVMPLQFSTQPPSPQSLNIGASLNLVYVVSNPNDTTIPLTTITFSPNSLYSPSAPTITPSGTNCSLTSIPPSSSCTYTVNLVAGSSPGIANNQELTISYQGAPNLVSNPISISVTSTTAALFFKSEPISTTIPENGNTDLKYLVTNPGTAPVTFTTQFTSSPSFFTSGTITDNCSSSVPAGGTCQITVPITALSNPGVAENQFLTVDDTIGSITSTPINITITSTSSQNLVFNSQPPAQLTLSPTGSINLVYNVGNASSSPVTISSLDFTSSSFYAVGPITVTNSGTGTGCSQTNVPINTDCVVTVPIAGNGSATTETVLAQLTVNYVGGGPLISFPPTQINFSTEALGLRFVRRDFPVIQNMPTYMQQTLTYEIKNTTNADIPITNISVTNSTGTATDTTVSNGYLNSCVFKSQSGVIGANQHCYFVVTLNSNGSIGTIQQNLVIDYPSGPLVSPISFSVVPQSISRTITFVNQCSREVAFGINISAANNNKGESPPQNDCQTSSDCNQGASCVLSNVTTGAKQCYWNAPLPANNNYVLDPAPSVGATGGTNSVTIPFTVNENPILQSEMFNANYSGRTGCTSASGSCTSADCSGGTGSFTGIIPSNGACGVGAGYSDPESLLEINMYVGAQDSNSTSVDSYDGSSINGFNVPMMLTLSHITPTNTYPGLDTNPFVCGSPGNPSDVTSNPTPGDPQTIGGCNWNYSWGSNQIYLTNISSPTSTICTSNTDCGTNLVCGVSNLSDTDSQNRPKTYCGTFEGYWGPGKACAKNSNLGSPYNCSTQSPSASGNTLNNWYECAGSPAAVASCYTSGATSNNCCGCQDWNTYGNPLIKMPNDPNIVQSCNGISSTGWVTALAGMESPLYFAGVAKQACPSFYSYPYDDKSSSYTCGYAGQGSHVGTPNTTNYTITFCPNGVTGAPS